LDKNKKTVGKLDISRVCLQSETTSFHILKRGCFVWINRMLSTGRTIGRCFFGLPNSFQSGGKTI
ncbi:hypothetical protein, partial [Bacillus canaveralius]|uniref:hypothetical protein n=1 Tax=Bacillus canaveralius TaxID=1403243 RepID=UPI001C60FC8B